MGVQLLEYQEVGALTTVVIASLSEVTSKSFAFISEFIAEDFRQV